MKIKKVSLNNRKKVIVVSLKTQDLSLPFSKLDIAPSQTNKIEEIFVDKELGSQAVTYILESGEENSIPLDAFLDYNRDPSYLREQLLFEMSMVAQKTMKKSSVSKNEICRQMKTSASQLSRLLDQTNKKKSIDKMIELLAILGIDVKATFSEAA